MRDDIVSGVFISVGFLMMLAGIGTGLLQCFWYLQSGEWTSISVIQAIWMFRGQSLTDDWVNNPQEWVGVHKILMQTPAGLAVFVSGLFPISIGAASS